MNRVTQIPVCIFGLGGVGRTLVSSILQNRQRHAKLGIEFALALVCDSSGTVNSKRGLSEQELNDILAWKEQGKRLSDYDGGSPIGEMERQFAGLCGPDSIVVDCTATDSCQPFLLEQSKAHGAVVCANKKPLTGSYEDFQILTQNASTFGYESTVGAGTPFIRTLHDLILGGDNVHKVQGMLSGTLGYVMSCTDSGDRLFSDIVNEAYNLGYTEPDPRDDLSGTDVARKAVIIARMMGLKVGMDDLSPQALYTDDMAALSIPDFMKGLPTLDENMKALSEEKLAQGKVLRYLASVDVKGGSASVGIEAVDRNSPFGLLQGSANMLTVVTDLYGEDNPLVVRGAGAGLEVTAKGCLSDMVRAGFVMAGNTANSKL